MFGTKGRSTLKANYYEGLTGLRHGHSCLIADDVDALLIQAERSYVSVTVPLSRVVNVAALLERDFLILCHNTAPPKDSEQSERCYFVIFYETAVGESRFIALWTENTPKCQSFCDRILERIASGPYTV